MKLMIASLLPTLLLTAAGAVPGKTRSLTFLPKSSPAETQMQPRRSLLPNVECNHDAVTDWVTRHVEGGRCEDFNGIVGGVELCRQFQNITNLEACDELSHQAPLTLSVGGSEPGPSPAEQCHFFVSHLLPHPYFVDIDTVVPVFGTSLEPPVHHECRESEEHDCIVEIHYVDDDRPLEVGETAAPTPAPFTEVLPCTECDFYYDDDEVCFDADCEVFNCLEAPAEEEPQDEEIVRSAPPFVRVCLKNERSDLFTFVEIRQGNFYGCSIQTEEKKWTTEFHTGVTNIQTIQFRLGVEELRADIDDYGTDFCELSVDGDVCDSCEICGANDTALVAFDCSNVVEDAVSSCHSQLDFHYGIARKLLVLQEGADPTQAVAAEEAPDSTPFPTEAPVDSSEGVADPVANSVIAAEEEEGSLQSASGAPEAGVSTLGLLAMLVIGIVI